MKTLLKRIEKFLYDLVLPFVVFVSIYAGIGIILYQNWRNIVRFFSVFTHINGLLTISALAGALMLYLIRQVLRIQYGFIEIMFGMISVYSSTAGEGNVRSMTLQAAAGVYIIVRGLDNIKNGLDENPKHELWGFWNKLYSREKIFKWKEYFVRK